MSTQTPTLQSGAGWAPPRPKLSRLKFTLRILGILCLLGAVGVGADIAWLLWGTGLTTQHAQAQLREQFHPIALPSPPAPNEPAPVKLPGDAVAILVIPR